MVIVAAVLWLLAMFAVAVYGERAPHSFARYWKYVYALSLAVHCTSWTFYGTVTQAARYGWPLPPTFVGAILFYIVAARFLVHLIRLTRESHATSIADLIATRLGKDAWLAALVTLVTALGLIPYIALQLKAITMSFSTVVGLPQESGDVLLWQDMALYTAVVMAVFAIMFGARRVSISESNHGLILAIAFESVFKLVAMLTLGIFVWFGLNTTTALPPLPVSTETGGFVPFMLLGGLAMFILPHQFYVAVVECKEQSHLKTARWLFPLYLLLIALPILPLARAGTALLGERVPTDMYSLALPYTQGHVGITLFAFLGGLSAATGMVVLSTLAMSMMIVNHWVTPTLLKSRWAQATDHDKSRYLLSSRRLGILIVMLLAWAYARLVGQGNVLADIGAVSFSAMATLAPALAFAVWRPQTPGRAASLGIIVAFLVWAWIMLVPMLRAVVPALAEFEKTVTLWGWITPEGFFGLSSWSQLARAVGASLFAGIVVTIVCAVSTPRLTAKQPGHFDTESLRRAARRFLPKERVDALLRDVPAGDVVPQSVEIKMERELAAVLGSSSARLLLDAARSEVRADLDTVATIVREASHDLRFNQRVLEGALENLSQGISVVDAELRLVAWNRRYAELFGYPEELLKVGMPIADVSRWALEKVGESADIEPKLQRRLDFMRTGTPHLSERIFPDGSIVEIRGNPLPGGGFVATFTDVTTFRHTESELKRSNETLEQRVEERTALLQSAKQEAEHANDAKSRFLTAIGHDLLQPLHAAHLFTDSLSQQSEVHLHGTIAQVRGALESTTDLLTGLLDISRLEAGELKPLQRQFPLADVLDPLASEFRAIAESKGLRFRYVSTQAWVETDPQLLRRILQNFLANAVRYTERGHVLLGVRHRQTTLSIEVHDTGPGIADDQQQRIFEEFRRGQDAGGQGLGIGLSIAEGFARLLDIPIVLRSELDKGTVFSVQMQRVMPVQTLTSVVQDEAQSQSQRILLVDNLPDVLLALKTQLEQWGYEVAAATNDAEAIAALDACDADLWLLDYHLDHGQTGVGLYEQLAHRFGARPALLLSADQTADVRRHVLEAGLTLLSKPIKPLALKSVLNRLLAARQAHRPSI